MTGTSYVLVCRNMIIHFKRKIKLISSAAKHIVNDSEGAMLQGERAGTSVLDTIFRIESGELNNPHRLFVTDLGIRILKDEFSNVLHRLWTDVFSFPLEECQTPLTVSFMVAG